MNTSKARVVLAVGVGVLFAGVAGARGAAVESRPTADQPRGGEGEVHPRQIIPVVRPLRESLIDLVEMAKERRPGQVMKGDPSPYGAGPKPMAEAPAAAPAAGAAAVAGASSPAPAVMLPNTAPESRPRVGPAVEPGASAGVSAAAVERLRSEAAPAGASVNGASAPGPAMGPGLAPGSVVMGLASPMGKGPARVRVESISGDASGVQWKAGAGAWATPSVGETLEGNVEVRAGLDGKVVLVADDQARVGVSRLARVVIERSAERGGGEAVSVGLTRGAVDVTPVSGTSSMFARIHTPDADFGLAGPVRVEYDAFTGTHRKVVNP